MLTRTENWLSPLEYKGFLRWHFSKTEGYYGVNLACCPRSKYKLRFKFIWVQATQGSESQMLGGIGSASLASRALPQFVQGKYQRTL